MKNKMDHFNELADAMAEVYRKIWEIRDTYPESKEHMQKLFEHIAEYYGPLF